VSRLSYYLVLQYLKSFSIIFFALVMFYIGVDYMQKYSSLPDSANLHVLYMFYNGYQAISFLLPLSVVFGFVAFMLRLIKSNEFTIIYSLGYKQRDIIVPILMTMLGLISTYMVLNFTDMAYAKEKFIKIQKGSYFSSYRDNLFLKYQNSYIYFGKLLPSKNLATNIRIFQLEDGKLKRYIDAKEGVFTGNEWVVKEATIMTTPETIELGSEGVVVEENRNISILQGFKPRILDSVYDDNSITFSLSIVDAISTWFLLNEENINSAKVRLIFYNMTISPLFAPFIVMIVFFFTPNSSRMFNSVLYGSIVVFSTLLIWGVLFLLSKIAFSGVISPEIAILIPTVVLGVIASYFYTRLDKDKYQKGA
jgi:lipopolysaccharide export system permease protein